MASYFTRRSRKYLLLLIVATLVCPTLAYAHQDEKKQSGQKQGETQSSRKGEQKQNRNNLQTAVHRVSRANDTATNKGAQTSHPLDPAILVAQKGLERIRGDITDYTCTLVKRERVNGVLGKSEYMFVKVRNRKHDAQGKLKTPFSVYLFFAKPKAAEGREVLFVENENEGKLIAHEGNKTLIGKAASLITLDLDPESALAMRGNRYPITELGIENLVEKLIEVATHDRQYQECTVKFYEGAKINGRECTCLEVVHPEKREHFRFHKARIYIDNELQVPIRFESYEWPEKKGGKPILLEEYTYLNLKINVGLKDIDFSRTNPKYKFK
ncbi:MAG: DUF1571 domain-containing protein [Pirellulaceae bacterium]|nr:DUF1571 domain-containing protein [Pirellulaceae bacterium]